MRVNNTLINRRNRQPSRYATRILLALCIMSASSVIHAHESRPAVLSMDEIGAGTYSVTWKVPAAGGEQLDLEVVFSEQCHVVERSSFVVVADAALQRIKLQCGVGGLPGTSIRFPGLSQTITDVFLRVLSADGNGYSAIIKPDQPFYVVADVPGGYEVAVSYGVLGIEHIATGIDHLLFIIVLMLLVPDLRSLLLTVTSFTVGHTLTLAVVSLGLVPQPGTGVEAVIALSILVLAYEVIRKRRGLSSITASFPWSVSLVFGLLHGFGFAGGLAQIGFPRGEIPLALLSFNLGIEIGQVAFVFMLVVISMLLRSVNVEHYHKASVATAWVAGIVSSYWLFARLGVMFSPA